MEKLIRFLKHNDITAKIIEVKNTAIADIVWLDMEDSIKKIKPLVEDIKYKFGYSNIAIYPDTIKRAVRIDLYKSNIDYIDKIPKVANRSLIVPIAEGLDGPIYHDFKVNPHLLIAGTTGSGKSQLLKHILDTLVINNPVFMIPLDFKGTELGKYIKLGFPFVTLDKYESGNLKYNSLSILDKVIATMNKRYDDCKTAGNTNSTELPLFLVVDELADIVLGDKELADIFSNSLSIIAQKSRAANIHLIIATQRPTVDVIQGHIKANIDTRIALKVSTGLESRIIIDDIGAELLDKGSIIYSKVTPQYGKVYRYKENPKVIERIEAQYIITKEAEDERNAADKVSEPLINETDISIENESERANAVFEHKVYVKQGLSDVNGETAYKEAWDSIGPLQRVNSILVSLNKTKGG